METHQPIITIGSHVWVQDPTVGWIDGKVVKVAGTKATIKSNGKKIVKKINNSIGEDPEASNIIGVLDIYSFKNFKINSFEQFCINYTNKKLQIILMTQNVYAKENIDWENINTTQNDDVLILIEKLLTLRNDFSSCQRFVEKMHQTWKSLNRFKKPKLSLTDFTINHYAGDVTYQADEFLNKNNDRVVAEHMDLLNTSECPFVANLFPPSPRESSKQSKFISLRTLFKNELQGLMQFLNSSAPHYIRCVKPNTDLKPGNFEKFNVLNQLRCGDCEED
ncbi:hypothetical protein H6P81_008741 [Aristolochia fimbriata]|uniref:Myosin motor domain-containing protein n=1 Tax=Aristolochia fimbriata TaxID=158543 RepID=A0AAV7EK51_ARIFI|nr:hypothetical protein H6P81_008741 [Aristolochia fimbriata]